MRARNISTRLCTTRVGSRRSGNTRAKLSAKPRRRSASARSITPPFEVRRPPSKAAVTFLASTAGNENGRIVSLVMAGVAFAVEGDGVGFATESYAASALYTTLASLSGAIWRIRRASATLREFRSAQSHAAGIGRQHIGTAHVTQAEWYSCGRLQIRMFFFASSQALQCHITHLTRHIPILDDRPSA